MKNIAIIISAFLTFVSFNINAQTKTPGEEFRHNKIFKSYMGWSVRFGGENSSYSTATVNTTTGDVMSSYKGTYKNSRVNFDGLIVELGPTIGKRFKVGIPLGFNVGLGPQSKKYTDEASGPNPIDAWPSGYGGNQGMEIGEKLAISFELSAGLGLAYTIVPAKNLQLAVSYNYRFWSKSNLAFYALPKFLGGFIDVNATYKRWHVATMFRVNTAKNVGIIGNTNIKTGYCSILPTYNMPTRDKQNKFRGGIRTVGLRMEVSTAKGSGSSTQGGARYENTLKASTFMMGVYFGLLF